MLLLTPLEESRPGYGGIVKLRTSAEGTRVLKRLGPTIPGKAAFSHNEGVAARTGKGLFGTAPAMASLADSFSNRLPAARRGLYGDVLV